MYDGENKKKSGFFAEFGSYIHLIMQLYLLGELKRHDLSTYYVAHFAENVRSKAPNHKIHLNYFNQGFYYLDNIDFPKREIIGVEDEVEFTFANKIWRGFIDVVSSDNGQLIITDHKSRTLKPRSKRSKPTKSDMELDDYLRQLYVYSVAVKDKYGRFPDILEFNCFRSQTMIREPFKADRLNEIESWTKKEIDQIILNDRWEPQPDYWKCNYLCDVCDDCEFKSS